MQSILDLSGGKYSCVTANLPQTNGRVVATTIVEDVSTHLLHYHEMSHLSFILNGAIVDKRRTFETERLSGELMFFHAGEAHQTIYKIFPATNINLELGNFFYEENSINEGLLKSSTENNPNVKFTMLKIYKELLTKDGDSDCSIGMLLLSLIESNDRAPNRRPIWIENVLELLNDNWSESITLKDLADAANVHPVTISKHFPKYIACTLGEYRRRLKIEKSLGFIKTSKFSLTEIAQRCGFADQSHFTRTFKHMTGFLPRDYQNS